MKKLLISLAAVTVIVVGCTSTQTTETPPGSGHYTTNTIVDPRLTGALDTVKGINDATAPVNPYAVPIDLGLGLVAAIATWVAKRKNDNAAQSQLLLKTVVQGVENSANAEVKTAIKEHAVNIGVEGSLSDAVAKINSGQG